MARAVETDPPDHQIERAQPIPEHFGCGVAVVATARQTPLVYAFEKSAVFGICAGGVPITITITLRSVSSIARGSSV